MNSQQSALRVARREAALRGKKVAVLNPADQHMYTVEPQRGTVVEKAVDPAHPKTRTAYRSALALACCRP